MDDETHGEGFGEECDVCSMGMEMFKERQNALMEKYGWVADCVRDPLYPYGMNYHTHGLQNFGHPDLQVCFPMDFRIIHAIIGDIVECVKKGRKFEEGEIHKGFLKNEMPITFVKATECDRPVLWVIFPDPKGCVNRDLIDEHYKIQFKT
jgi:hypothetical protein